MKIKFLLKTFILALSITFLVSCDKDFNEIGVDLVGDDHFGLELYSGASVKAYSKASGIVQTNNLPINALGVYDNSVFGKTTSSFVTQLELGTVDPKFYEPSIGIGDSVYVYVPYYSTLNSDGTAYSLDSIYGGNSRIKLKLYESNRYLQSLDPNDNLQSDLKYFSDQNSEFDNSIVGNPLNDSALDSGQNENFSFKSTPINITYNGAVTKKLAPGIFLDLNKAFFQNKILNAPQGKLLNNNIFKEYFRGLYFKAESHATDSGAMAMLNFKGGSITILYKDYANEAAITTGVKIRKTLTINFNGNTVNLHQNTYNSNNSNYLNAINATSHPETGDENLYLKGQNGAFSVIELFGSTDVKGIDQNTGLLNNIPNGRSDELDEISANKWLINEANLTFYINRDQMGNNPEPNRVYLYDLKNSKPLIDYSIDQTVSSNTKYNKVSHGGIILNKTEDGVVKGVRYKVRITNHIRDLVRYKDSNNVKLGLVVIEDITRPQNYYLKNPFVLDTNTIKYLPYMSIINPLGTVLYGSNTSVPLQKRLKLEIYYTKPE